ncbi:MAG: hypothetical protein R3F54_10230 [Alphaproteobacteria bacterium]
MSKFMRFLPSRRRIGLWLRTHQLVPPRPARFRILLADLHGDDEARTQTRHLETALLDQAGIVVMPVGETLQIADGEIDPAALETCRSLIAGHNGDSLIFGEVMPKAPRLRIRMVGRYEQEAGRHGPYQMDWTELPKHFGPDVEGLLLALTALSVSPAAQNDQDRAWLINLLRPATTKLTRLLEQPSQTIDSERQGVCWHALGIAASLLGEYTQSRRWPEVAVHAHRTALLIWQQDTVVFQWAMVQNNLGHALRLLALQQSDRREQVLLLQQATEAFQQALRVYRAAAAAEFYLRQTETNLAHAEALLAERPIAAA